MPVLAHILRSLHGVARLARFERAGFSEVDPTAAGAALSFIAAMMLLPIDCGLTLLQDHQALASTDPLRFWAVQAIAFVLSWTAYAVMMIDLTTFLGCFGRYYGFLSAYNWSMVIQTSLYVPMFLVAETDLFPAEVTNLIGLLVTAAVMIYQGFVTMVALEVSALTAGPLVLLDLMVSLLISASADLLLGVAH